MLLLNISNNEVDNSCTEGVVVCHQLMWFVANNPVTCKEKRWSCYSHRFVRMMYVRMMYGACHHSCCYQNVHGNDQDFQIVIRTGFCCFRCTNTAAEQHTNVFFVPVIKFF